MGSYAGTTLMGSQPVAGRVRAAAQVCVSGRSIASPLPAHAKGGWQLGTAVVGLAEATKPATRMFDVPDTTRTRRSRGTP